MEDSMKRCEVCGNTYDKAFTVDMDGATHVFDRAASRIASERRSRGDETEVRQGGAEDGRVGDAPPQERHAQERA